MSRVSKVHTTKVRQQHSGTKQAKPGRAVNGANLVQQKDMSSKKAAKKGRGH